MDITEAEDIKKRRQEYTEELYKKDLHDPDNHNGVITYLKTGILDFVVKKIWESLLTVGCFMIKREHLNWRDAYLK